MNRLEAEPLGDRIDEHWYYRGKAKAMQRMLGPVDIGTILDVDGGSGYFAKCLLAHAGASEAWCVDASCDVDADTLHAGKPLRYRNTVDTIDVDLVLLIDVLACVEDDLGLLKARVDRAASGTRFLVMVPAFPLLWSEQDVALGHRRRYLLDGLEDVVRQSGLETIQGCYYFGALFSTMAGTRIAERKRPNARRPPTPLRLPSPWINTALGTLCDLELPLMRFNRTAGLVALNLSRKP